MTSPQRFVNILKRNPHPLGGIGQRPFNDLAGTLLTLQPLPPDSAIEGNMITHILYMTDAGDGAYHMLLLRTESNLFVRMTVLKPERQQEIQALLDESVNKYWALPIALDEFQKGRIFQRYDNASMAKIWEDTGLNDR